MRWRKGMLVLLAAALAAAGGCAATPSAPAAPTAFPELPRPSTLQNLRAASIKRVVNGADFDSAVLSPQGVTAEDSGALFSPQAQPGLAGAAFAAYSISAQDLKSCVWRSTWDYSAEGSAMHIGWANFAQDRWDWSSLKPGGAMQKQSLQSYTSAENTLLIVVLLTGPGPARLSSFSLQSLEPPHWDIVLVDWREAVNQGAFGADTPFISVVDGKPAILYNWDASAPGQNGVYCTYSVTPDGRSQEDWYRAQAADLPVDGSWPSYSMVNGRLSFSLVREAGPGSAASSLEYFMAPQPAGPWDGVVLLDENATAVEYRNPGPVTDIAGQPALLFTYDISNVPWTYYMRANGPSGFETWDVYAADDRNCNVSNLLELDGRPAFMQQRDDRFYWRLGEGTVPENPGQWLDVALPQTGSSVQFGKIRGLHLLGAEIYLVQDFDSTSLWHCSLESQGLAGWDFIDGADHPELEALVPMFNNVVRAVNGKLVIARSQFGPLELWFGRPELLEEDNWARLSPRPERVALSESSSRQILSVTEVLGRPALAFTESEYEGSTPGLSRLYYGLYSEEAF